MGHLNSYNKNQIRDNFSLVLFLMMNGGALQMDVLYYIMDYSGNYYKINEADQLVTVTCEQEADVFTFAQGNRRISGGKKASFYCLVPLKESGKEQREEEKEEEQKIAETVEEQEKSEADETISIVKELAYEEVSDPIRKNAVTDNLAEMDWAAYLAHFISIVNSLKDYREELSQKHSDIDQKICDILHYIELCETNHEEAVDLIELLRVCRENRRDIKDELQRIEYFQNNIGTNANVSKAKQAMKSIQGLEKRKYKPRKYDELFENCILKDRRLRRDDLSETENSNTTKKQIVQLKDIYEKEREEAVVRQERKNTPFDTKENDWLSFARQQAEFYRNAGSYIENLQLDIQKIDSEIEEILLKTEDANCNVAQGYQVFKRLKELRLEKKTKTQELHCLYALTGYIDCEALADTCEANLAEVEDIMGITAQEDEEKNPVEKEQPEELHVIQKITNMVG